jgi:putative redox protein
MIVAPPDAVSTPTKGPRSSVQPRCQSTTLEVVQDGIRVTHKEGDLFEIRVRDHLVHVDQPVDAGGSDAAPTPTEMFVVSLASCVAFYVRRFLVRHDLPMEGLSVDAAFTMAERPARVDRITLSISLPPAVPEERRAALLAVASHCTVHNSLEQPPDVRIAIAA